MSKKIKIKAVPSKIKIIEKKHDSSNLEGEIEKEETKELKNFISSDSSSSGASSPLINSSGESSVRRSGVSEEDSSSLRTQRADAPFAYSSSNSISKTQDARTYSEPSNPSLSPVFRPEDNRSREVANARFSPLSSLDSSSDDFRAEADRFAREYEEKKKKRYPWQA